MSTPEQLAIGRVYPELTWTAITVGWILGVIIAISIGYAALILGFSIKGSELAAILGFGILRGALPMHVKAWCICLACRCMRT